MRYCLSILSAIFLMTSCSVEPTPIVYGKDECAFCIMKIMDARFGAEAVTDKGKIYKFDSAECMVQFTKSKGKEHSYAHLMVTHIHEPEMLHSVHESHFVISENIPSPMGGNLSSYPSLKDAQKAIADNEGSLFSWDDLISGKHKNQ
ncbi:MAG: nitrous oxide reductase accessory protein NosL [Schleiferiaceae bacterium]|jgi:copper chaperone NosL|nr:nitrous oxide reductase accessory protein NosL [Schleiferiaceae bacterium]